MVQTIYLVCSHLELHGDSYERKHCYCATRARAVKEIEILQAQYDDPDYYIKEINVLP